jgi:restriction system protein
MLPLASRTATGLWVCGYLFFPGFLKKTTDMAKKTSALEGFIYLASKLPWWISLALAAASGMYLHSVASAPMPTSVDMRHFDTVLTGTAFRGMATVGQFFVPMIFIGGAVGSILGRARRRKLLDSVNTPGGNTLLSISWQDFERLVGEALRRRGYAVQENGANGPDGGIDLVAREEGETYLVQCKQWRSVQVGVPVVRELYGAMAAEGAVGGFVVTSGTFTQQARDFASGRNLQLVDGSVLKQWIAEAKKPAPRPTVEVVEERVEPVVVAQPVRRKVEPEVKAEVEAPACPHCRKRMVVRVARTGANAGGNFWGCVDYPKCRGIRAIFAPMKVR